MDKKLVTVYPVEGRYLEGSGSHTVQQVDSETATAWCATGAFTTDPPPNVTTAQPEDPADAGSLDSEA